MSTRSRVGALAAVVAVGFALFGAAKSVPAPPGLLPYTPTRLEWAALELQANHGDTGEAIMVSFRPGNDGFTILCVLRYPADTSTSALAMARDTVKQVFEIYRDGKGWAWLRLEFRDEALGR